MVAVLYAKIAASQPSRIPVAGSDAERSVERCIKRIRLAADSYGGKVVGQGSDNLTLVFARGSDAFLAAGIIQQRIADLAAISRIQLAVRIGICSDEVLGEPDAPQDKLEQVAARLADMAYPAQALFCLEAGKLADLPAGAERNVRPLPDVTLAVGAKTYGVCDFLWQESRGLTPRRLAEEVLVGRRHFRIRHNSHEFALGDDRPCLTIGRNPDCDVNLSSRKVSRHHARIERRDNHLVVVDGSANGTYIYQNGKAEVLLHNAERIISGRGELCIGAPATAAGVDKLSFEA